MSLAILIAYLVYSKLKLIRMSTACSILVLVINLLVTSKSGAGLADVCEHGGDCSFLAFAEVGEW